jgi:hypothetical protein
LQSRRASALVGRTAPRDDAACEDPLMDPAHSPSTPGPNVPVSAADFANAADRLKRLLKNHGIVPNPASWPSRMIREVRERPAWAEEHEVRDGVVRSNLFRSLQRAQRQADLLIVVDLIELAAAALPRESATKRLRMLARKEHAATARSEWSKARDLIFELMCAGWMSKMAATDIDLVDPPDVLCTYRGVRFGVACKGAYGSADTAVKAVKKGVDQLEKSDCTAGAVVVRMTDVFPHDELVPGRSEGMRSIPSFPSGDALMSHAASLALPFRDEVIRRSQGGATFFARSKKLLAVWFVAHSFGNVSTGRGASSVMCSIPLYLARDPGVRPFLDEFITATWL